MISTLTLSTVAIIASQTVVDALALIGFLFLLALLFQKEIASRAGSRFKNLPRTLSIAIVPLLITFILVVASKMIEVIR